MNADGKSVLQQRVSAKSVAVMVLLAVVGVGLFLAVQKQLAQYSRERRARAAVPRIYREASEQRDRLIAAIALYKQAYGFYPPDHVVSTNPLVIGTVTNQLFYELTGCSYSESNGNYYPNGRSEELPRGLIQSLFGKDITNSVRVPGMPKSFLPSARSETLSEIHERPQSIGLLSYWPAWEGLDGEMTDFDIATWQYNSSSPRHNVRGYDLWLEIKVGGTNLVISNW